MSEYSCVYIKYYNKGILPFSSVIQNEDNSQFSKEFLVSVFSVQQIIKKAESELKKKSSDLIKLWGKSTAIEGFVISTKYIVRAN